MPAPTLITPDHRLLGWALSDLTVYGGQPTAGVTIGRATDAGIPTSDAPAVVDGHDAHPSDPQMLAPSPASIAGETGTATLVPTSLSASPGALSPVIHASPLVSPDDHRASVPDAIGSGTTSPIQVATPLQAVAGEHGGTEVDPLGTAVAAPAPLSGEAHGPMSIVSDAVIAPVTAVIDHAGTGIEQTIGAIGQAPLGLTNVAGSLDQAAHSLDDSLGSVGQATDAAVHAATATLDDAVATTFSTPVAPLADLTLAGLGGTDPAGGITTLVGMVHNADAFDLTHVTTPEAASPVGTLIDALAADEAPHALIGDVAHGDAGDGGLVDHHLHLGL